MQIFRASSHSSLNQRLKKNGEKRNAERPNFAGDLTQTSWIIDIVRGMLCDQNSFYGVGLVRSHPLRKGKASPHNVDLIFSLNWKWTLFMLARKTKKRNGTRLPTKSSHSLHDYARYCLGNFYFISAFIIARYILWFTVLLLHHEQPGNILQSYQHLHSWRHVNHCTAAPDICPLSNNEWEKTISFHVSIRSFSGKTGSVGLRSPNKLIIEKWILFVVERKKNNEITWFHKKRGNPTTRASTVLLWMKVSRLCCFNHDLFSGISFTSYS